MGHPFIMLNTITATFIVSAPMGVVRVVTAISSFVKTSAEKMLSETYF